MEEQLVDKVAAIIRHDPTHNALPLAQAAIAMVLREMITYQQERGFLGPAGFVTTFAAEHGIALAPPTVKAGEK